MGHPVHIQSRAVGTAAQELTKMFCTMPKGSASEGSVVLTCIFLKLPLACFIDYHQVLQKKRKGKGREDRKNCPVKCFGERNCAWLMAPVTKHMLGSFFITAPTGRANVNCKALAGVWLEIPCGYEVKTAFKTDRHCEPLRT